MAVERRFITGWRLPATGEVGISIDDAGVITVRDSAGGGTALPAEPSPPFPDPSGATPGQVLGLDSNLDPAWVDPEWLEPPANASAPVISPVAASGHTAAAGDWLAVSVLGQWTGPYITGFSHHWKMDAGAGWVDVPGDPSWPFVEAVAGRSYRCTVTATNAQGSVAVDSNVIAIT